MFEQFISKPKCKLVFYGEVLVQCSLSLQCISHLKINKFNIHKFIDFQDHLTFSKTWFIFFPPNYNLLEFIFLIA
jgi:hypothetical protein